jgi:Protein of unknown function (DUF1236)
MRLELVRTCAVLVLVWGAVESAAAQQSPAAESQQQQQQDKAQQTPSGKMGKEEPSSHAPSDKPADNSVFVNGALAVPGAPANTDTVPAKFSEKNAADDKLITLAYTFKLLTDEQRRAIYEGLKGQGAGPAFNADIGVELPSTIELRPVPNDVAARVPQTKDYRYAVADNRVLLVAPVGRFVVGVFMDDVQGSKPGEGRRTP